MKKLLLISSAFILLCANVSWAVCLHSEVEAADDRWKQAIASEDVDAVTALYAENSVLVPTYSDEIYDTDKQRRKYFENLFEEVRFLRVHYQGPKHIIIHDGGAVSSGFYTFSGIQDWEFVEKPARYTFVYKDSYHGCELITHHSSALPVVEHGNLIAK
jgi:hypothetical protein